MAFPALVALLPLLREALGDSDNVGRIVPNKERKNAECFIFHV